DRIRKRHGELASTRADEIVNIAQQRMSSAIRSLPKQQGKEAEINEDQISGEQSDAENDDSSSANTRAAQLPNRDKTRRQTALKPSEKGAGTAQAKGASSNKSGASGSIA